MNQTSILNHIPGIPNFAHGWSESVAVHRAAQQQMDLSPDHWDVIYFLRALHQRRGDELSGRDVSRILAEHFRLEGGRRHLYRLFPRGPVVQACHLAGVELPHGTLDTSFGTVQ